MGEGRYKVPVVVIVMLCVVFVGLFLCSQNVSASSYDNCIKASGGRGGIDSVQWACKQYKPWNSNAACSLWIGGSKSDSTVIEVSQLNGTVTAYMYGMCTKGSYAARDVYVENDNGAFKDGNLGNVKRGKWGSPKSTPINVNVGKFVKGVSPKHTSNGDEYTRNVKIHRCFVSSSSCSSQYSAVTIRVKNAKVGSIVVQGNSELTSVEDTKLEGGTYQAVGDNIVAHFKHSLKQSSNQFNKTLSVSYGLRTSFNRSASISNGAVFVDPNDNTETKEVKLSTSDTSDNFCQYISFQSRTWDVYLMSGVIALNDIGRSNEACAEVHRPWNFKIDEIEKSSYEKDSKNIVYAGEKTKLGYSLNIIKNNNDYPITDIPNATITISDNYGNSKNIYENATIHHSCENDGSCINTNTNYGYSSNKDSHNVNIYDGEWTVPDLPAGTEYCLTVSVTPQNSGDGYYDNFNRESIIREDCYKVAKKPSIQVWGGNVYTSNGISTYAATKYNLAEVNGYKYNGTYPKVFGSWGELGVISNGVITDFASGAATGYANDNFGGGNEDFCVRSVLTFANSNCDKKTGLIGGMGATAIRSRVSNDKNSIINKLINSDDYKKNKEYSENNMTISGSALGKNELKIAYSEKNIYINGDIIFGDDYTKLYEIPKMVIYAEGDIYIDCSVTRIDALLMADGIVRTCVKEKSNIDAGSISNETLNMDSLCVPSENAWERSAILVNGKFESNQLTINGAVIANGLSADRTYGAATGINSIVPAEIINFDPSLYLWDGDVEETEDGIVLPGELDTVYSHELAPRQ